MNTVWCPVRLHSDDRELIENIRSICFSIGAFDFQSRPLLAQGQQEDTLARLVLIDLQIGATLDPADECISRALQRKPRDVVIGIGTGFLGSTVAHWARHGMHGLVDSPLRRPDFEKTIREANMHCVSLRIEQSELRMLSMQRNSMTKREEEVLDMVVQGIPNKSIASKLDVSQRTIESRRQKIYQKMNAKRLTDLIRALDKLEFLSRTLNGFA